MNAAILALFIPAEFPVGNIFRRKVLECAEQDVSLWDLMLLSQNADLYQIFEGLIERAGSVGIAGHC